MKVAGPGRTLGMRLWLAKHREWLWIVLLADLGGAFYGFAWYSDQLTTAPIWFWPMIPDCPLAVLVSVGVIVAALRKRRAWVWQGLAAALMLKYGLWTEMVLGGYFITSAGNVTPEQVCLAIAHLGMIAQGVVFFMTLSNVSRPAWVGIAGWLLLNDLIDYGYQMYPWLPFERQDTQLILPWLTGFTVALSVLMLQILRVRSKGFRKLKTMPSEPELQLP